MTRFLVAAAVLGALAAPAIADDHTVVTTRLDPREPSYAAWIAIPSIDGASGAEVGAERRIAPRLAIAVDLGVRKSATADYSGYTVGAGGELRWFWRGTALWSHASGSDRVGWFTGARLEAARTSLSMDGRAIGSTWTVGGVAELGYRLTPWRGLAVTGLLTAGQRVEFGGGVPAWRRGSFGLGLELGWMF